MVLFVIIISFVLFILWTMLRCASICDAMDEEKYKLQNKSKKM